MTTKYLSAWGNFEQFHTDNGVVLAGGKIYTYAAGTSTPATTYQDVNGAASHANPIVLDSDGQLPAPIWVTGGSSYKFILKTSADVAVGPTFDNIPGVGDPTGLVSDNSEWQDLDATPTQTSATTFTVDGDYTSLLHTGRRLKFTDGTTKYGAIGATSYSSGTQKTTVTVTLSAGASLTSSLSAVAYGLLTAQNTGKPTDGPPAYTAADAAETITRGSPEVIEQTPTADRVLTFDTSFKNGDCRKVANKATATYKITLKANDAATIIEVPPGGVASMVCLEDAPSTNTKWAAEGSKKASTTYWGGATAPSTPAAAHVTDYAVATDAFSVAKSAKRIINEAATIWELGGGAAKTISVAGIDLNSYVDSTGTSGVANTSQVVKAVTLKGGSLNAVPRSARLYGWLLASGGGGTITATVKFGGTTLFTKQLTASGVETTIPSAIMFEITVFWLSNTSVIAIGYLGPGNGENPPAVALNKLSNPVTVSTLASDQTLEVSQNAVASALLTVKVLAIMQQG